MISSRYRYTSTLPATLLRLPLMDFIAATWPTVTFHLIIAEISRVDVETAATTRKSSANPLLPSKANAVALQDLR